MLRPTEVAGGVPLARSLGVATTLVLPGRSFTGESHATGTCDEETHDFTMLSGQALSRGSAWRSAGRGTEGLLYGPKNRTALGRWELVNGRQDVLA